jgi:hypothetical protein
LSGICSTSSFNCLTIPGGVLIYHSSLQISTLLIILLQAKNTTLLFLTAAFISCITLPTFEANVATITLQSMFLTTFSKFSQISFSDFVVHHLEAVHKLSQM